MSIFSAPNFYAPVDRGFYDQGYTALPQSKFTFGINLNNSPTSATTTGAPSGIQTLPINMNRVASGSGSGGTGNVDIDQLLKNYTLDTRNQYFGSQETPLVDNLYQSKLDQTFMGMPSFRQQELTGPDMGEYIASGMDIPLEQTAAGRVQSTLGNIKDKAGGIISKIGSFGPISFLANKMDNFGNLSAADQEFIKMNMGYTGPTVFGSNDSGLSKDPFGINTRSALGNYAEYVGDKYSSLGDMLGGKCQKNMVLNLILKQELL